MGAAATRVDAVEVGQLLSLPPLPVALQLVQQRFELVVVGRQGEAEQEDCVLEASARVDLRLDRQPSVEQHEHGRACR